MYALSPIQESRPIVDLPTRMYKLPTIQGVDEDANQGSKTSSQQQAICAIESRQEAIMERLSDLQGRVRKAREELGMTTGKARTECDLPPKSLVIQCSPNSPPYALVCMAEDLAKHCHDLLLDTTCHFHSSLTEPIDDLMDFLPDGNDDGGQGKKKKKRTFELKIIWKEMGKDPQAAVGSSVIRGEANIARLLARSFPDIFNYEQPAEPAKTNRADEWMDRAWGDVLYGCEADRKRFLADLEASLGGRSHQHSIDGGKRLGLADYVVWSLLVKSGMVLSAPHLRRWSNACRAASGGRAHARTRMPSHREGGAGRGGSHDEGKRVRRRSSRKHSQRESFSGSNSRPRGGGGRGPRRVSGGGSANGANGETDDDKRGRLQAMLQELEIPFDVHEHPPVRTVEEMLPHLEGARGVKCKNFFLRDKRGKLFVLTAPHDREVGLAGVGKAVGAKDLRFAPESLLRAKLGVEPGCLTPFAVANDTPGEVQLLVDEALTERGDGQWLLLHPMVNTATVGIPAGALDKFARHVKHPFKTLKL